MNKCLSSLLKTNPKELLDSQLHMNASHINLICGSTCYVLFRFLLCMLYNWVTDCLLLINNHLLMENITFAESMKLCNETSEHFNTAGLDNITVTRKSLINSIPWDNAGSLLVISTLLTIPKLRRLKNLINIRCLMKDPQTEISDLKIDIETVVTRHDSSLAEAATESSVQIVFQWGSYMGLI